MKLSIVTTLYQSQSCLEAFYRRISEAAQAITRDYELIYVNDGSPDDVLALALAQQRRDDRIVIVDLSRNFGHHAAGLAGLAQARGQFVFLIDCDLEEKPEWLNELFWPVWQNSTDLDLLYGVQTRRKGNGFERCSGACFYRLFNALSAIQIPQNMLTVRLMSRRFVDALLLYQEKSLFLGGVMAHAGFRQQALPVQKSSRGSSSYTFGKRLALFVTAITAFSARPLFAIGLTGLSMLAVSLLFTIVWSLQTLFWEITISDRDILLLAMSFLASIIVSCTGLLGLYLAKIHDEVKQRPGVIIKKIYRAKHE